MYLYLRYISKVSSPTLSYLDRPLAQKCLPHVLHVDIDERVDEGQHAIRLIEDVAIPLRHQVARRGLARPWGPGEPIHLPLLIRPRCNVRAAECKLVFDHIPGSVT